MEPDAYKTNAFLDILLILGVPAAAPQGRQDRRGPSLRPWSKLTEMELNACLTNAFLDIL